jgi:hypothetical protein
LLLGVWLDTVSFYGAAGLEFDLPAARPLPKLIPASIFVMINPPSPK